MSYSIVFDDTLVEHTLESTAVALVSGFTISSSSQWVSVTTFTLSYFINTHFQGVFFKIHRQILISFGMH